VGKLQQSTLDEHASRGYGELRQVAGNLLAVKTLWTLSPTGLVHEAFIKLARSSNPNWADHRHFVSACAQAMRHLLVDRARKKVAVVHGGHLERVPLTDAILGSLDSDRLVALNEALQGLDSVDIRQAEIVQLRFFTGLTNQEVADLMGISRRTVQTEWRMARAWLHRELNDEPNERAASKSERAVFKGDRAS